MRRSTVFVSCVLVTATVILTPIAGAEIPHYEREALITFYHATGGDGWANNEGWLQPPGTECEWFGVGCDTAGSSVIGLVLDSNELEGTLPPEIADLQFLEVLFLGKADSDQPPNRLHGEIPPELGSLGHLTALDLWGNLLSGQIPPELGHLANLVFLDLDENRFTGVLPDTLGDLGRLEHMWIGGSDLHGGIPESFGGLSELRHLGLWGNGLTGGIPASLGNLGNLETLVLAWNPLGGQIPVELGNLSRLETLHIWDCSLEGDLPHELGNLHALRSLFAGGNRFTGPIPRGLGSLPNLERIMLQGNLLNGEIPSELGGIETLQELRLEWNALVGEIPSELGRLENLWSLGLSGNLLTGDIPVELGELANLVELQLSVNQLDGPIPAELGALQSLEFLDLSWNHLDGGLPTDLGLLANLRVFDISSNRLEGFLPSHLGNLRNLLYLHLRGNRFIGRVPESFGRLENLVDGEGLDLRWNALFTDNADLSAFLESKQLDGDWWSTQTLPPFEVAVGGVGIDMAEIGWSPVLYSWDDGGIRVWLSTRPDAGHELYGETDSKEATVMLLENLQPDTTYYAVVQTVTYANEINQNTVESVPSQTVSFTTGSVADCRLSCSATAPARAEVGEVVTFQGTVQSENCEDGPAIRWSFGDGGGADGESASHAYDATGTYTWTLTATADEVACTSTGTVAVFEPQTECGNDICELGESAWTCEADCGFDDEETGRAGASATKSAVPAAVGGISGVGGTYWVSEAMIHNPGDDDATVSLRFTADGSSGQTLTAGPFAVAAGAAAFFDNFVQDLFGVSSNGSVLIDSDEALMVVSRTFNDQPGGSFGQFLGAVGANRIFGVGDVAYLVGLSENDAFRTNVIVQEVAGRKTTVTLRLYDDDGDLLGSRNLEVTASTKRQDRLLSLGFEDLSHGYATVEVASGGKIVAIASVVDEGTGDAMTVDAVHASQVALTSAESAEKRGLAMDFTWAPRSPVAGESVYFTNQSTTSASSWSWNFGDGTSSTDENPVHAFSTAGTYPVTLAAASSIGTSFVTKTVTVVDEPEEASRYLVAVVAHLPGSGGTQWRSDLWVLNPMDGTQTVRLDYRPESGTGLYSDELIVPSGAQVAVEDVLGELFSDAGDGKGSLKVQSPDGVMVSSRTYNLSDDGTFGQAIPALGAGDMIAAGEQGTLLKLKNTAETRCNMGFAEFDGLNTRVRVKLYSVATAGAVQELASKAYTVSAGLVKQVNLIFNDMNVSGSHEAAFATVEVISGGTVYAYASNVDVRTGDAEFIPAMKE